MYCVNSKERLLVHPALEYVDAELAQATHMHLSLSLSLSLPLYMYIYIYIERERDFVYVYIYIYTYKRMYRSTRSLCEGRRERPPQRGRAPEAWGKILHTRNHRSEHMLENVTESPLDNSSKNPLDK